MTREEAKLIALKEIEEGIRQEGENTVFIMSPKTGKCSWTYKEARDSILEDKCLEGSNANLIDMVLKYEKYMEKRQ
mgnify:CR=1 FL=1